MLEPTAGPFNIKSPDINSTLQRLQGIQKQLAASETSTALHGDNNEKVPQSDPSEHYHISNSHKVHLNVTKWLVDNKEDQAVNVCFLLTFQMVINDITPRTFFQL